MPASASKAQVSGLVFFAQMRREPLEVRKATLASILRKSHHGLRLNEPLAHDCGLTVFQQACQLGCEGIVSKRLGSHYRSGRSPDWLKFKNRGLLPLSEKRRRIGAASAWGGLAQHSVRVPEAHPYLFQNVTHPNIECGDV
jgi:hypothetical protein